MLVTVFRVIGSHDCLPGRCVPMVCLHEAHPRSWTAKTTIYCANIAAGLMLAQFAKWMRGVPVECDVQLNLLADEWVVHRVVGQEAL